MRRSNSFSNTARSSLVLLVCCLALWFTLVADSRPAQAQVQCDLPGTIATVATAAELNAAISCHAFGSINRIELANDIEATELSGGAVFQPITGAGDLTIYSRLHTLRRSVAAPDTPMPLLAVGSGIGKVEFVEANIEVGLFDTVGIDHTGDMELRLRSTSIQSGPDGTIASGVRTSDSNGQFFMNQSLISSVPIGLDVDGSAVFIENSTIASANTDIRVATANPGGVSNSVLAGPVGVELLSGGLHVEHSTILGDGAAPAVGATEDSFVTFLSSIVQSCTADEFATPTQPGPGWGDLGYNVGGCFDISSSPTLVPVLHCLNRNPAGCLPTAEIGPLDAAREAGQCDTGRFGGVELDHRGQLRSPGGIGCDAGAYEYLGPPGTCQLDGLTDYAYQASTAAELNASIRCHNQSATATRTTILLLDDIAADTVAADSVFERVMRGAVVIEGAPNLLDAAQGVRLSRGPAAGTQPLPLLAGEPDAEVDLGALHLELGPYDTYGLQAGMAEIAAVALTSDDPHPDAVGVSSRNGPLVLNSMIQGVSVGFEYLADEDSEFSAIISNSSIASTSIDVRSLGPAGLKMIRSTLGGPVGIVIDQGRASVEGSTILGDVVVEPTGGENAVVGFENSIANTCSADQVANFSSGPGWFSSMPNNAGACFADSAMVTTSPLADNGCQYVTPLGCTLTAAIDATSPAFRAADPCSQFGDQRNMPRGDICDAGAYETEFVDGDVNGNGTVDNADVQAILEWLAGGTEPAAIPLGDLDLSGATTLSDALALAQLVAG